MSQMRMTEAELATAKALFADNDEALKLLRKIFLPSVEPDAPIGQVVDMWYGVDISQLTPEQAMVQLTARNQLIRHLEYCLFQLKALAGRKDETPEQTKKRLEKDSAK